jgi:hypothetical protein
MKKDKIPNHKHQITNKSQISKINDQNSAYSRIALFRNRRHVGDNAYG